MPTLKDLLSVAGARTGLSLELKSPANSPGVATLLAQELNAAKLTDGRTLPSGAYRVQVHSRDQAALRSSTRPRPRCSSPT